MFVVGLRCEEQLNPKQGSVPPCLTLYKEGNAAGRGLSRAQVGIYKEAYIFYAALLPELFPTKPHASTRFQFTKGFSDGQAQ